MFNIILYQPEIPPNTGNVIRLCANTGAQLHLIEPLGFKMEDSALRRAGLDYHEWATVKIYPNLESCLASLQTRVFALSTKGAVRYDTIAFQPNDAFLFGPETRGLPEEVRAQFPCLSLPMQPHSRSLNLSNSVSVVLFEAWRQCGFQNII
ncbi:MAG: tRNA (cytidine(34)-2'-O)-methyltransferase [Gammaproteobacteria bacterium]